jgi:hypothetical protein
MSGECRRYDTTFIDIGAFSLVRATLGLRLLVRDLHDLRPGRVVQG